ncbi:NAD(P)-binding domain-containing protein [Streptomyces sp. NBC_00996]|uniref:NAD(P)-binding domain-containing protein n=1 Tax=Streptomyces sp. NBC_00996 TaxID=2903710 RepID=UPI00386F6062
MSRSTAAAPVVVIGAGPYGLSTAAHLKARGLHVRVFGSPMASWAENMPAGMLLKSPPSASLLSAPHTGFTLDAYCREAGETRLTGHDPVPVEMFFRYGRWFAEQLVPEVENVRVLGIGRQTDGFHLKLASGEELRTQAVVAARGMDGFAYVPEALVPLVPEGLVSHSSQHADLAKFAGHDGVVVGAGQSAQESAALLGEAGARVRLTARTQRLVFGTAPTPPPHWQPDTPLGRSWGLYAVVHHAAAFRFLPVPTRLRLIKRVLGPFGSWWLKPRLDGVPVRLGEIITGPSGTGMLSVSRLGVPTDALTRSKRGTSWLPRATGSSWTLWTSSPLSCGPSWPGPAGPPLWTPGSSPRCRGSTSPASGQRPPSVR